MSSGLTPLKKSTIKAFKSLKIVVNSTLNAAF